MGGELIISILQTNMEKMPDTLGLSCHTSVDLLRGRLSDNGYYFEAEAIVEEREHFYPVMRVRRDIVK